jgi:hypothetical protein
MRRALVAVMAMAGLAHANGRPSAVSTINFKPGDPNEIAAGLTFGLVLSHDRGQTWHWMCEKAVGYGGMWDPDYAYTASGALFATTFGGLKVMRDGCVFGAAPPGMTFVSQVEVAPNGDLFYAAADKADGNIYRSTDDGMTFPTSTAPGRANDWWDSLVFSRANPQRAYLAGYRYQSHCIEGTVGAGDDCITDADCPIIEPREKAGATCSDASKQYLLARSDDAGVSFHLLVKLGLPRPTNSGALQIIGIDPVDPDIVYAKIIGDVGGETLYVSKDGAQSWTRNVHEPEPFAFLARASGELVIATKLSGAQRSLDHGGTWTDLPSPPHIGCLSEDAAGDVWACTQNYAQMMNMEMPAIPSDGFGIMKSSDLTTWTGVMRFQDIADPVSCPAGTAQHDQCVEKDDGMPSVWCCLAMQQGITNAGADCSGRLACVAPPMEAPPSRDVIKAPSPPSGGCCDAGATGSPWLALSVLFVLRRRRR